MNRPVALMWSALGFMACAALVAGAFQAGSKLWDQTTAAWVQALGSIGAIVGATMIAGRQSREALTREERQRALEEERRTRDEAVALLAASRLVSIFRVKLDAYVERVEEADHEFNTSWVGVPLRAGFASALRSMTSYPIASIPSADALFTYTRAIEVADLVVALFASMWELLEKYPASADQLVRARLPQFQAFAAEIRGYDETLRDVAEPGWRGRLGEAS